MTPGAQTVPMYTSAASVPAPSYGTIPTPRMGIDHSFVRVAAQEVKEVPPAEPAIQEPILKSPFTRGEPAPTRKSFADITAASCFSHTPDYSTICGQLELRRANNSWRLRYLSVDETDQNGGSVTLTGDSAQMAGLKDGQCIKVQGHLSDPDKKGIAPFYRAESIIPIDSASQ